MKSFSLFLEEASASKMEADFREKNAREFTRKMRKKSAQKTKESLKAIIKQKEKAQSLKKQQYLQQQQAREKAAKTSEQLGVATKAAINATKKIKNIVKNKKKG